MLSISRIKLEPRPMAVERGGSRRFAQPKTRVARGTDFFIWIRCNPLKSPDSAKGIQGNASFFAWFYLVFLAFIWR
jgi:hypothetical protein